MSAPETVVAFAERFWSKVAVRDARHCWLWTAGCTDDGYGAIKVAGRSTPAHVVAFWLWHYRWPTGLVCHTCDVRDCVNPHHLYDGDIQSNATDAVLRLRLRVPKPNARGARNHDAKLTEADVRTIRRALSLGETKAALARHFGVSRNAIHLIATRENWAWLM